MSRVADAAGVLFGLLLYYIWTFIILLIQSFFFAEKHIIHGTLVFEIPNNDVFTWLSVGLLALYLLLGHYIFTKNASDLEILKNLLLGFSVWLGVLVILSLFGFSMSAILQQSFDLRPSSSTFATVSVGYLVMFAIYLKRITF